MRIDFSKKDKEVHMSKNSKANYCTAAANWQIHTCIPLYMYTLEWWLVV